MKDKQEFYDLLAEVEGQPLREYARIIGDYDFGRFVVRITRTPSEPSDAPMVFLARVPAAVSAYPPTLFSTALRRTALEDLLARKLAQAIDRVASFDDQGIARRRLIPAYPGQKILPRSTVAVSDDFIEARLAARLPSRGGLIDSAEAQDLFFRQLPMVVNDALIYCNLDEAQAAAFVECMEDAATIRDLLSTRGMIAFVADGARLSRNSGSDLPAPTAPAFAIDPPSLVEFQVPNRGRIRGLGIRSGLTVVIGDALSGRIDLMKALAAGIYNHIPGDGREYVISHPDTVYIKAEEGRCVQRVDLTPFFLPAGEGFDPARFTSSHAGTFESQAAAVAEALEAGARVLLFDESDSAADFLAVDPRLSRAAPGAVALTAPLVKCARALVDKAGISIVVAGCSAVAPFIPLADTVYAVENNRIREITREAKTLEIGSGGGDKDTQAIQRLTERSRLIVPASVDPAVGRYDGVVSFDAEGGLLRFGRQTIDIRAIEQIADSHQAETIGLALYYAKQRYLDVARPLKELLDLLDRDLSLEGIDCLTRDMRSDLARPRRYEIAAVLNRLPSLRIARQAE